MPLVPRGPPRDMNVSNSLGVNMLDLPSFVWSNKLSKMQKHATKVISNR